MAFEIAEREVVQKLSVPKVLKALDEVKCERFFFFFRVSKSQW